MEGSVPPLPRTSSGITLAEATMNIREQRRNGMAGAMPSTNKPLIANRHKRAPSRNERGLQNGASEEVRTLDIHLGKVVLYQLSYARLLENG